jgi:hypothetical protein
MDNKNEKKSHEKLISMIGQCQGNYIPSFAFRMTQLTPKQKALLFRIPHLSDNDYLACFYSSKSIATLVFDDTLSANAVDQLIKEVKHNGYLDVLEIEVYGRINRGLRVSEKFCNECNKLNKDNQERIAKFKRLSKNHRSICRNHL